jgi:alkanesulfonate monooxygenase SsuD/methylene tetrahydromethanopterin reductase-like flavin-dependent oxidoreductase (luciferase family)
LNRANSPRAIHLGLGVAYGPFEAVGKATRYYRDACHGFGWQPAPEQIIYRANILLAATDEEAQDLMKIHRAAVDAFPLRPAVRESLLQLDSRNMAGERRPAMVGGVLPTNFLGGPDTVVEQIKRCRDQVGAGVIDLMFQTPNSADPADALMQTLKLFGEDVLPRVRDI